jgi:hypothetical protein
MAIFNEILVGRYNRALQKLLAIKGPPPVRQVGGEIVPAFTIFYGAENRYLEGWNRFGVAGSAGPVAAQPNNFRFRNPAKSGVIAVIEKITFSSAANDLLAGGRILSAGVLPTIDLTVAQNGFQIDLRQGDPNTLNSACRTSRDTGSSPNTNTFWLAQVLANTPVDVMVDENQEYVVAPGDVLQFDSTTVNTKCTLAWLWRERPIEESELK